jgi:hypothetical protein
MTMGIGIGLGLGLSSLVGLAGGAPLPYNTRTAIIGDSILAALTTSNPPVYYNTLSSIVDWANALSGSRLFVVQGGNTSVGSQDSGTIAGRFTTSLAPLDVKLVFVNAGINDLPGVSAATILANWDSMISQALVLGIIIIALPVLPASNQDAAAILRAASVNSGLMARASNKFYVIDITGYDYTTMAYAENGAFGPAGVRIHPNIIGAQQLLGTRAATIIQALVGSGSPLILPSDPKNLFPYGAMSGTGGSFVGTGTGQIASDWQIYCDNAGGATVAASKVGDWQRVAISGTYSGDGKKIELTSGFDFSGGAAFNQYEYTFEVQISGCQNIDTIQAVCYLQSADYSTEVGSASLFQNNVANNSGGYDVADFSGVYRVMPASLQNLAPPHGRIFITACLREGGSSTPVTGTFQVRNVGMKKLDAGAPGKMLAPTLAPTSGGIQVTRAGNTPANGAAITGYDILYSSDGVNWTTVAMTTNPQVVTGLTNGTLYQVYTVAKNSVGSGPAGFIASATPAISYTSLFMNGEDGAYYDLSDIASLFQDTSGTTPVTTAGQSIGRINDKSGRGHHLPASDNSTKRGTYGTTTAKYVMLDGSDDQYEATGFTNIVSVAMLIYVDAAAGSFACAARFSTVNDNAILARNGATTQWRSDGGTLLTFDNANMKINGIATRDYSSAGVWKVVFMRKTYTGGNTTIFHLGDNRSGVDRFTGRVALAVLLDRNFTTDEEAFLLSDMKAKAGIP